jgi:hypothetical protein
VSLANFYNSTWIYFEHFYEKDCFFVKTGSLTKLAISTTILLLITLIAYLLSPYTHPVSYLHCVWRFIAFCYSDLTLGEFLIIFLSNFVFCFIFATCYTVLLLIVLWFLCSNLLKFAYYRYKYFLCTYIALVDFS